MRNRRLFVISCLTAALAAIFCGFDLAQAGPGTGAPEAAATPSGGTFFANSPILAKFADSLPQIGASGANNLGQYIPVAAPNTQTIFPNDDYYEIALVEYREQMHSNLPAVQSPDGKKTNPLATGGAKLRGYVQEVNGVQVGEPHYLGPLINATKDRPVRIKFTNRLPAGSGGNLFLPVDASVKGAGVGPLTSGGAPCNPANPSDTCASYTQNRATLHLQGAATAWISDGTPHQWITPAAETTPFVRGASQKNVPDMWFDSNGHLVAAGTPGATNDPGPGSATYFFPNAQSARMMFYHDNTYGISRLNFYAGEAAPYLLSDSTEQALISSGVIPSAQIPLIIQDKTFVPQNIAVQDTKWDTTKWGGYGNLWFPHVYETNEWPTNPDGSTWNIFGRWDYGPWASDGFTVGPGFENIYQSATSITPEAFGDTPLVNGTAYPYLQVDRKAYRLRVLNASNDRWLNLQLYYADQSDPNGGEVRMLPATPHPAYEAVADFYGQGTSFYLNSAWTNITPGTVQDMVFSAATSTLYASFQGQGLWAYDGLNWTQLTGLNPSTMLVVGSDLYASFDSWGLWKWDGSAAARWTELTGASVSNMAASGSTLYANFGVWGLWKLAGSTWTQLSSAAAPCMAVSGADLYASFGVYGLWKLSGSNWTQLGGAAPSDLAVSGPTLYVNFGVWGLWSLTGSTWTLMTPAAPVKMVVSGSDLFVDFGAQGLWRWSGAAWTQLNTAAPGGMDASAAGLYCSYGAWGLWKWTPGGANGVWTPLSSASSHKVLALTTSAWPASWPTDYRDGGAPDPGAAGPQMIQIGSEGGFLPAPALVPSRPVGYDPTVFNIVDHALLLGPGERADVIVDFSQVPANSRLILYNDAPAPNPMFDPRYDYYTNDPDYSRNPFIAGGAPTTLAGYGPNIRTVMQFRVSSAAPAPAYDLAALQAALPAAYAAQQPKPIVAEAAYNTAFGKSYSNTYATADNGSTLPTFDFTAGRAFNYVDNGTPPATQHVAEGAQAQVPVQNKSLEAVPPNQADNYDKYGRVSPLIGTLTTDGNLNMVPFMYIDPPTETLGPGLAQVWKFTHWGFDAHTIHFHLLNAQVINRVAWDGTTIMPPDANEVGWKETIRMNPLEDVFVALLPATPAIPFTVPASSRLLDVTMPQSSTGQFSNLDPATGGTITVTNTLTDFGWELLWGCDALGHQESDMKRPLVFQGPTTP